MASDFMIDSRRKALTKQKQTWDRAISVTSTQIVRIDNDDPPLQKIGPRSLDRDSRRAQLPSLPAVSYAWHGDARRRMASSLIWRNPTAASGWKSSYLLSPCLASGFLSLPH